MTRTQIYDAIQLLDHFGDHACILGLTIGEIDILNAMKRDLIRSLCNDGDSKPDLRLLQGNVRVKAPGPCPTK